MERRWKLTGATVAALCVLAAGAAAQQQLGRTTAISLPLGDTVDDLTFPKFIALPESPEDLDSLEDVLQAQLQKDLGGDITGEEFDDDTSLFRPMGVFPPPTAISIDPAGISSETVELDDLFDNDPETLEVESKENFNTGSDETDFVVLDGFSVTGNGAVTSGGVLTSVPLSAAGPQEPQIMLESASDAGIILASTGPQIPQETGITLSAAGPRVPHDTLNSFDDSQLPGAPLGVAVANVLDQETGGQISVPLDAGPPQVIIEVSQPLDQGEISHELAAAQLSIAPEDEIFPDVQSVGLLPTEVPNTESIPTDVPSVDPVPAETREADSPPVQESAVDPVPTEAPVTDAAATETPEFVPEDTMEAEAADAAPVAVATDHTPAETPVNPSLSEALVDPVLAEEPADPAPVETPADPVLAKTPADLVLEETPADPVLAEAPADSVLAEVPADSVLAEAPDDPVRAEALVDPVLLEAPADSVLEAAGKEAELPGGVEFEVPINTLSEEPSLAEVVDTVPPATVLLDSLTSEAEVPPAVVVDTETDVTGLDVETEQVITNIADTTAGEPVVVLPVAPTGTGRNVDDPLIPVVVVPEAAVPLQEDLMVMEPSGFGEMLPKEEEAATRAGTGGIVDVAAPLVPVEEVNAVPEEPTDLNPEIQIITGGELPPISVQDMGRLAEIIADDPDTGEVFDETPPDIVPEISEADLENFFVAEDPEATEGEEYVLGVSVQEVVQQLPEDQVNLAALPDIAPFTPTQEGQIPEEIVQASLDALQAQIAASMGDFGQKMPEVDIRVPAPGAEPSPVVFPVDRPAPAPAPVRAPAPAPVRAPAPAPVATLAPAPKPVPAPPPIAAPAPAPVHAPAPVATLPPAPKPVPAPPPIAAPAPVRAPAPAPVATLPPAPKPVPAPPPIAAPAPAPVHAPAPAPVRAPVPAPVRSPAPAPVPAPVNMYGGPPPSVYGPPISHTYGPPPTPTKSYGRPSTVKYKPTSSFRPYRPPTSHVHIQEPKPEDFRPYTHPRPVYGVPPAPSYRPRPTSYQRPSHMPSSYGPPTTKPSTYKAPTTTTMSYSATTKTPTTTTMAYSVKTKTSTTTIKPKPSYKPHEPATTTTDKPHKPPKPVLAPLVIPGHPYSLVLPEKPRDGPYNAWPQSTESGARRPPSFRFRYPFGKPSESRRQRLEVPDSVVRLLNAAQPEWVAGLEPQRW
ncbi:cell surface glycoprotein 1-like isoform X2 [Homarus americanus]|uniref:cell surface glycoprotein 1-like isoform X2 n=1 Tax=Homarus americanus TaxID=6706 RepID=UPI001C46B966|nr:cell surface glycoprotein 1-like isoform X2 [Homarus americanus]